MGQPPADEAASIEIDGQPPTPAQLAGQALDGYGHFTAMQVRNGRVRGLKYHEARLTSAHREMFGCELDPGLVGANIRHSLAAHQATDASVRVYLRQVNDRPQITVTVRPPGGLPQQPWRLKAVPYQRAVAHLKHLGDFGQAYYRRRACAEGFDEALLTASDGSISEGSVTNVGFWDGTDIIWPDAPMLVGVTMRILTELLGLTRRETIRTTDLAAARAAFVTSARGIAPVGVIDDQVIPVDQELMKSLLQAYESAAWDAI